MENAPQLLPPDTPLPWKTRLLLRWILGPRLNQVAPSESRVALEKGRAKILETLAQIPESEREKKILVDPIPGLEDASRYWSARDVVEHLVVIHESIFRMVEALAQGQVPPGDIRLARFKPRGENTYENLLASFEASTAKLLTKGEALAQKAPTRVRKQHPWMGKLNAQGWYALAGNHLFIHLKQLRGIRAGL